MEKALTSVARFILAACLAAGSAQAAEQKPPVVLVHGFLGFDNTTLGGTFRYWGGFNDLAKHIETSTGRRVFTAGVGPVSSNWDRAIELYYQIKGGCADYGAEHVARNSVAAEQAKPEGKCWPGMYPQWDDKHPIHLVGHSQGGQTIRTLIQLLEKPGASDPQCVDQGDLLKGGKCGWVTSATTIATPHNGTTLRDIVVNSLPNASELAGQAVQVFGAGGSNGSGFKFRLEQYGIANNATESTKDFFERTKGQSFWRLENHDSAQWDLTPDGARELNAWVKTSPSVYYFSIAAQATEPFPLFGDEIQYPIISKMNPLLQNTAGRWVGPLFRQPGMGAFQQAAPGRVPTDKRWFANDGVVNTVSMYGPEGSTIQALDGPPAKGAWNLIEVKQGFDHFDVIGWKINSSETFKMYDKLMAILSKLD